MKKRNREIHTTTKKKKLIIKISAITATVLSILSGVIIPYALISHKSKTMDMNIYTAPEQYYVASSTAMAKNASQHLYAIDRIKLVSGNWSSTYSECSLDDGILSESEAVQLAKKKIQLYYRVGVYPYSLESTYNNWYSWESRLYCYTDNLFNTYTTYLWSFTFTSFDNTLIHHILMTEDGTIISAEVNNPDNTCSSIKKLYLDKKPLDIFNSNSIIINSISVSSAELPQISYPDIDMTNAEITTKYILSISLSGSEPSNYIVYQYKTDTSYGVGIVPQD